MDYPMPMTRAMKYAMLTLLIFCSATGLPYKSRSTTIYLLLVWLLNSRISLKEHSYIVIQPTRGVSPISWQLQLLLIDSFIKLDLLGVLSKCAPCVYVLSSSSRERLKHGTFNLIQSLKLNPSSLTRLIISLKRIVLRFFTAWRPSFKFR